MKEITGGVTAAKGFQAASTAGSGRPFRETFGL